MAKPTKPGKSAGADRESVSVRKIHNGFITTRLGTRDGKFFKSEQYSRRQPVVETAVPKPTPRERSTSRPVPGILRGDNG